MSRDQHRAKAGERERERERKRGTSQVPSPQIIVQFLLPLQLIVDDFMVVGSIDKGASKGNLANKVQFCALRQLNRMFLQAEGDTHPRKQLMECGLILVLPQSIFIPVLCLFLFVYRTVT